MGRAPCCDKANVKRGPWSSEEDAKLKSYIDVHGTGGNWIALPQKIGLKRCGKSCRLRWLNYLRPNIKHGGFSEEEDDIICGLYISIGSRWSIIAGQLPGRTDNDIKNYWNTRLKKRLMGKQRRDHHQQRRRSRGGNQEAKRVEAQESGGGGRSSTHWSSWPVHASSQTGPRADIDEGLDGRFSTDDGVRNPTPLAVDSPVLHRDSSDQMAVGVGVGMQDPTGFPTEIGEMLNCSPVKLEGLDCFYGEGMIMADERNMVSTSEGANWREVSPPAYRPMIPSYQGMHQLLFGDLVQLGML